MPVRHYRGQALLRGKHVWNHPNSAVKARAAQKGREAGQFVPRDRKLVIFHDEMGNPKRVWFDRRPKQPVPEGLVAQAYAPLPPALRKYKEAVKKGARIPKKGEAWGNLAVAVKEGKKLKPKPLMWSMA